MGSQRVGHDWATSLSLSLCESIRTLGFRISLHLREGRGHLSSVFQSPSHQSVGTVPDNQENNSTWYFLGACYLPGIESPSLDELLNSDKFMQIPSFHRVVANRSWIMNYVVNKWIQFTCSTCKGGPVFVTFLKVKMHYITALTVRLVLNRGLMHIGGRCLSPCLLLVCLVRFFLWSLKMV